VSNPILRNDLFWQNRAFNISVGGNGPGQLEQQHLVTLLPALTQPQTDALTTVGGSSVITGGTGACVTGATYWDIGVRGDVSSTPGSSVPANTGFKLSPQYSILTNGNAYGPFGTTHNLAGNPLVAQQYCNGARTPPEDGGSGYAVPPGISDATLPNPVFNLTPSATVDEGNNWVNMAYGPLSLVNPAILSSDATNYNQPLGNYAITGSSPAIGSALGGVAPTHDFFGTPRPQARLGQGGFDIGAVEFVGTSGAPAVTLAAVTSATFPQVNMPVTNASAPTLDFRLSNAGPGTFTITGITVGAAPFSRITTGVTGNCGGTLTSGANCIIRVRFLPTTPGTFNGSVAVNGTGPGGIADPVTGSPLAVTGTGVQGAITFSLGTASSTSIALNFPLGIPTLTFGTQANTPAPAATATLILTNSGNAPINFTTPAGGDTVIGNRFAKGADSCQGTTALAAGAQCTIVVTFSPNSSVIRVGALTVRDNAAGANQNVVLAGN